MKYLLISILVIVVSVLYLAIKPSYYLPNFEENTCPFCYGQEFCTNALRENLTLRMTSVSDVFNHLFSVKNVYFTTNGIVLKKLGHNEDLLTMSQDICSLNHKSPNCELKTLDVNKFNYKELLRDIIKMSGRGYIICGQDVDKSIDVFLQSLMKSTRSNMDVEELIHLFTISLINFEPLFYKVFHNDFFLPKYYGACGRVIAVENCGNSLNAYETYDWFTRATIARSLIGLALKFTDGNHDFRVYLTDVSPDNIVVNEFTFEVKFVDFGNVVLVHKANVLINHTSLNHPDVDGFMYSEADICESRISDHNIYSICKLILSYNAPWPMMPGGLLHSVPMEVNSEHPDLLQVIDSCIQPSNKINRFESIAKIDQILKHILRKHTFT